jgi:hypothetical protein
MGKKKYDLKLRNHGNENSWFFFSFPMSDALIWKETPLSVAD